MTEKKIYMKGKNGKIWVNKGHLSQRTVDVGGIHFHQGDAVGIDEEGNLYNISAYYDPNTGRKISPAWKLK